MIDYKKAAQIARKAFKLQKGAARKLFPFDPRKDIKYDEPVKTWVITGSPKIREHLDPLEGPAKKRGLNKLAGRTQSRKNPQTGEREFLLHRGMSSPEKENFSGKEPGIRTRTSWTPHYNIAVNFAAEAEDQAEDYPDVGGGHVISAWIPESKIIHLPYMLGHNRSIHDMKHESEVIVSPHQFNIVNTRPWSEATLHENWPPIKKNLSLLEKVAKLKDPEPTGTTVDITKDQESKPPIPPPRPMTPASYVVPSVLTRDDIHPAWKDHNSHLVHGLRPGEGVDEIEINPGITWGVQVVKHNHPGINHVLVKPPLNVGGEFGVNTSSPAHSHLDSFPSTHREATYQRLAEKFFGLGKYVPKSTLFKHPIGDTYSAHQYIENTTPLIEKFNRMALDDAGDRTEYLTSILPDEDIQKITLMNFLMGNRDRHGGNVLIDHKNGFHLIDHGGAFDYSNIYGGQWPYYLQGMRYSHIKPEVHFWIDSLNPHQYKKELSDVGIDPKLGAVAVNRLRELKRWSMQARQDRAMGKREPGTIDEAVSHILIHKIQRDGEITPDNEAQIMREALGQKTRSK